MPNQLSKSKRRQSMAEHEAVLTALRMIAQAEQTSVMSLLREASRNLVKKRAIQSPNADLLRQAVWAKAPVMPKQFKTAEQVARFKREQREFDQACLDMGLVSAQEVQERNSIIPSQVSIRMINFARAHAATAI